MILRLRLPLLFSLLCIAASLTAQSGWDGNAAAGYADDFPPTGYWGLSNAFLPDSVVLVTNLETNRQLKVTILGRKDDRNLFLVLSPTAARELGINERIPTRVRVNPLSGGERLNTLTEPALHPDGDINPAAAVQRQRRGEISRSTTPSSPPHTLITPARKLPEDEAIIEESDNIRGTIVAPPASHERREVSELQIARTRRKVLRPLHDSGNGPTAPEPEPIPELPPEPPLPEPIPELLPEPTPEPVPEPPPPPPAPEPEEPAPQLSEGYPTVDGANGLLIKPDPRNENESPTTEEQPPPTPERIVRLEPTTERPAQPLALPQKRPADIQKDGRYIQIGAFKDNESAKQLAAQIQERGLEIFSYTITSGNLSRVLIGPVADDEYGSLLQWLRSRGFTDAFSRRGSELL